MIRDHPHVAETQPFRCVWAALLAGMNAHRCFGCSIKVKEINFSYHVEKVFAVDIPALQHENDGLIYTCVSTPYTPGTDPNM